MQALYNNDDDQVTIRAALTADTPRTVAALLTDPRTDDDSPADPATSNNAMSHLGSAPNPRVTIHNDWHRKNAARIAGFAFRGAMVAGQAGGRW